MKLIKLRSLLCALTFFVILPGNLVAEMESAVLKENGLGAGNLKGKARFSWFIFEVFNAKLYTERAVNSFEDIADGSGDVFLELTYSRAIPKEDFISSSEESLASNPEIVKANIDRRLQDLYQVYEKVEAGDRYALFYFAMSEKTCLFKNDKLKVCIPGQDFAKAYFGIWLSEYSVDPGFSKKLLGLKN